METRLRYIAVVIMSVISLSMMGGHTVSASSSDTAPYVGENLWGVRCHGTRKPQEVFDYTLRAAFQTQLRLTENFHFSSNVENLISGDTSRNALDDIDFTLTRWPNHHRALNSAVRARTKNPDSFKTNGYTPAECYLQRAINFSPKDATSVMLFGNLLQRLGFLDEARLQYSKAESLDPDSLELKYNFGLLMVRLKKYDEAKEYASYVYSRGFPLPGLKRKLKRLGYSI